MNENPFLKNARTIDIPKVFKTFVSEEHFTSCIICEKYLLDENTEYVIEKVMKDGYAEVEYAMCLDCVEDMRKKMSSESLQRIGEFFENRVDFVNKRYNLMQLQDCNVDDYISRCLVHDTSINDLKEYQIFAHCRGKQLVLSVFPYMIGHDATEEVQELLSAKTKEELDRFTDKYFGLPPDLREIIRNKNLILI